MNESVLSLKERTMKLRSTDEYVSF